MRRALIGGAIALGVLLALAATHLALIEVGREVVTLRTPRPDGTWKETRLWVVDDGDTTWVHSKGAEWLARFEGDPVVELERGGETHRYRAHAVPGPHPRVDRLLREKYGWVDRWVRFLSPCVEDVVPVRLERLPDAA